MNSLTGLLLAIAALIGSATAIGTLIITRRNDQDENDVQQRTSDFEILRGTIAELRTDLGEARKETAELQGALDAARDDARKLQRELTTALANVALLNQFIDDHVPVEVTRPRLRKVWP